MKKMSQHKKRMIYIAIGIFLFLLLYALKNTSYFFRAFGFIFSIFIFFTIDKFFNFGFKKYHYLIFILISSLGVLLSPLYFMYPNYDKTLHLISPILFSILIFFLINQTKLQFSTKLMITFAFVIAFLALFEIGEYLLDQFLDLKLQGVYIRDYSGIAKFKIIQNKNDDTMIDLIFGTIGSLCFVAIKTTAFYYKKHRKKILKVFSI